MLVLKWWLLCPLAEIQRCGLARLVFVGPSRSSRSLGQQAFSVPSRGLGRVFLEPTPHLGQLAFAVPSRRCLLLERAFLVPSRLLEPLAFLERSRLLEPQVFLERPLPLEPLVFLVRSRLLEQLVSLEL